MNIDPRAEMYEAWSPYNYVMNNPIIHVDPDGKSVENEYDLDVSSGKYTKVSDKGRDKTDYVNVKAGGKTLFTTSEKVQKTTVNIKTNSEIGSSTTERLPGEIRTTKWKPSSGALHEPSAGIFAAYAGGKILSTIVEGAVGLLFKVNVVNRGKF